MQPFPDREHALCQNPRIVLMIMIALPLLLVPSGQSVSGQSELEGCIQAFERGEYQQAEILLRSLVAADPGNHTAVYYLGRTCLTQQMNREAVKWMETAVELNPGEVLYHKWLYKAYNARAMDIGQIRALGLTRKIMRELETIVELDPTSWDEWINLIMVNYFLPKIFGGDKEYALELVGELRRINPREGSWVMAEIHIENGNYSEAMQECQNYLRTSPDDIKVRKQLGRVYHAMERWEDAFGIFEEIISEVPEEYHTYYQMGRSASTAGRNLERGAECLKFFIDHTDGDEEELPTHADAHWRLGLIREHQDDIEAARAEYEAALRIDPDHSSARTALRKLRKK